MGHEGLLDRVGSPAPIYVWDIVHRRLVHEILGLAGSVHCISTSGDSKFGCAIGGNSIVLVFELSSGEVVYSRRFDTVPIVCVWVASFTPYNFLIVSDSQICVCEMSFDLCCMKYVVNSNLVFFGNLSRKLLHNGACVILENNLLFLTSVTGDILVYKLLLADLGVSFVGSIGQSVTHMKLVSKDTLALVISASKIVFAKFANGRLENCFDPVPLGDSVVVSNIEYANGLLYVQNLDGRLDYFTVSACTTIESKKNISNSISGPATSIAIYRDPNNNTQDTTLHASEHPSTTIIFTRNNLIEFWKNDEKLHSKSLKSSPTVCALIGELCLCGFADGSVDCAYVHDSSAMRVLIPKAHRGPVSTLASSLSYIITGGKMDGTVRFWKKYNFSSVAVSVAVCADFEISLGGAITHIRTDSVYTYCSNDRGELFAIKNEKIYRKFNTKSFGKIVGIIPITVHVGTINYDLMVVSCHQEGKLVWWDFDYADSQKICTCTHEFSSICMSSENIVCGCTNGQLALVDDNDLITLHDIENISPEPIVHIQTDMKRILCTMASGFIVILKNSLY